MTRKAGIQTKVVVPFVVLFLVATVLTALSTMRVTSHLVEDAWRRQMTDVAALIDQGGVPLTQGTLEKLRTILAVEIVQVDGDASVRLSTLPPSASAALPDALRRAGFAPRDETPAPPPLPLALDGAAYVVYRVTVNRGAAPPDGSRLLFLVRRETLDEAKRRAAAPIVLVAGISLILVVLVGYAIAATITRPVRTLAEVTGRIAAGNLDERVTVSGGGELAELADSFNRMVEGLRESQHRLIRSERLAAIGELAAGVAHEIRNPLSAIRMNVQMLRASGENEAGLVEAVIEEIDRLEGAIEGLLAFATPRPPRLQSVDLNAVVDAALRFMRRQFDHAHVTVQADLASDLPPLQAEEARIRQVVVNLLVNAANAMVRGGPVRVTTRVEGETAVLEIADAGEGVDPALGERVFEPFVTTRARGTGLGLAITRRIVEEHGGCIGHRAADGGGTVFFVRLPLAGPPERTERAGEEGAS